MFDISAFLVVAKEYPDNSWMKNLHLSAGWLSEMDMDEYDEYDEYG